MNDIRTNEKLQMNVIRLGVMELRASSPCTRGHLALWFNTQCVGVNSWSKAIKAADWFIGWAKERNLVTVETDLDDGSIVVELQPYLVFEDTRDLVIS